MEAIDAVWQRAAEASGLQRCVQGDGRVGYVFLTQQLERMDARMCSEEEEEEEERVEGQDAAGGGEAASAAAAAAAGAGASGAWDAGEERREGEGEDVDREEEEKHETHKGKRRKRKKKKSKGGGGESTGDGDDPAVAVVSGTTRSSMRLRKGSGGEGERGADGEKAHVKWGDVRIREFHAALGGDGVPTDGETVGICLDYDRPAAANPEGTVLSVDEAEVRAWQELDARFEQLAPEEKARAVPRQTRQFDFKRGVDNPLYVRLGEHMRKEMVQPLSADKLRHESTLLADLRISRQAVGCDCASVRHVERWTRGRVAKELNDRSLDAAGTKAELVERLRAAFKAEPLCCATAPVECPCALAGIACHESACKCCATTHALQPCANEAGIASFDSSSVRKHRRAVVGDADADADGGGSRNSSSPTPRRQRTASEGELASTTTTQPEGEHDSDEQIMATPLSTTRKSTTTSNSNSNNNSKGSHGKRRRQRRRPRAYSVGC